VRRLTAVEELTSRLKDDEVSQAIAKLEAQVGSDYTADLCLASSIIEVGVDIDRLSVMAVVGQPKTTAQYIQVTGRVGRKWQERPGLVAVIYSASKARDKSHFEHFRSYHERLYAQVEPTSVTPFSLPVLERALHAAAAVYVRQMGPASAAESPYPVPKGLLERFRQLLESRSLAAEENERAEESRQQLLAVLARRIRQWEAWQPRSWTSRDGGDVPLLRRPGEYVNEVDKAKSWSTPMSMRNVDAECQLVISALLTTSD
jgi:superfamily II DNA or RNA helicase